MTAAWQDVGPSICGVDCGAPLVEPEGPEVAGLVGRQAVGSDMVGARVIQHRSQARRVELQHLQEPRRIGGPPIADVMTTVSDIR